MNDWQYQRRWMLLIVQHGVRGGYKPASVLDFLARVQVSIKTREIAAGNLQSERVPVQENIAGGPEVECNFICLTGIHERRMFARIPVSHAQDAFRNVHCKTI